MLFRTDRQQHGIITAQQFAGAHAGTHVHAGPKFNLLGKQLFQPAVDNILLQLP